MDQWKFAFSFYYSYIVDVPSSTNLFRNTMLIDTFTLTAGQGSIFSSKDRYINDDNRSVECVIIEYNLTFYVSIIIIAMLIHAAQDI